MPQSHDTDRTKFDTRDYSVQCVQCGKYFAATRSDASFCSARCRVAHSREPQKLANALEDLRFSGIRARDVARKYSRSGKAFEAMQELSRQVNAALAEFEQE